MVHTSKTGIATSEIKFLVGPVVEPRLREWARTHFTPDPHGTGVNADEYETGTLYFDTVELDVFGRRGSYARAKYRIRRYDDSAIFLERKLRKPGVLIKRRVVCPIDGLDRLNEADVVSGWSGEWFHRRLRIRRLLPACQVSYRRMARSLDTPEGSVRLTLDTCLRVRAADETRFSDGAATPFLEAYAILELKVGGRMPAICRRVVEEFALSPHQVSKYRLGTTVLLNQDGRHAVASRLTGAGVMHA